ncbi:hypothetical protein [Hafnia alvei]|uniref:hypothetical protein n=1 Tax=Hafnia alvei TaxID=569 RepID=UPI000583B284|nr:hypothetical protein [Hafnia alvei]ANC42850.1 hypothetical protein A6V27_20725 [Hafnia alvei]KID00985.1 hypothetical protein PU00_15660 [Hafnia alvei]KKI42069.1 hypothetical protein XK86_18475 [Hafnia alvei]
MNYFYIPVIYLAAIIIFMFLVWLFFLILIFPVYNKGFMPVPKVNICSVAFATIFLMGCDSHLKADVSTVPASSISINVLPVIVSAVFNAVPEINSDNRDAVLNGICRVAYGEIKPTALRDDLNQAGVISKDSVKDNAFTKMIQSEDIKPYQTACAAYMITSIETIPDVNQFVSQHKDTKGQAAIEANEGAVINLMPFRLAVARATAELYGKLAVDLSEKKAQSMEMYNQKIYRLFNQSAEGYLNNVRKYNQEEMGHRYQLLLLQKGRFTFKSTTGYLIDVSQKGMSVYLYGTPWLADGYVLGVVHKADFDMK